MIDRNDKTLSLSCQARLLSVSRGSLYSVPKPVNQADLDLMKRLDQLHLDYPFAGSRMLRGLLLAEGVSVGRRHVRTLMKHIGIEALYRKPRTTKPAEGYKIFPYLLREIPVIRPMQVWCMDITYIPMRKGFVYLAAVMDWHSRKILSWRLSITMETDFCLEVVEEALNRFGKPEIFNTDQGSQFTSREFISLLQNNAIRISMDGKGAWRDNVFIERFWRSLKYEEIYLKAYESVPQARQQIRNWMAFYNTIRPHSALDRRTPDQAFFNPQQLITAA